MRVEKSLEEIVYAMNGALRRKNYLAVLDYCSMLISATVRVMANNKGGVDDNDKSAD